MNNRLVKKWFRAAIAGGVFFVALFFVGRASVFSQEEGVTGAVAVTGVRAANDSGQASMAEPNATKILAVSVGVSGFYKNGFATPVRVEWTSSDVTGGKLELETLDPDGVPFVVRQSVEPSETVRNRGDRMTDPKRGHSTGEMTVYVPFGKGNGTLSVRLRNGDGGLLAERTLAPTKPKSPLFRDGKSTAQSDVGGPRDRFSLPADPFRPVWLVVGGDSGLTELVAELRLDEDRRPILWPVERFEDLPTEGIGYAAAELLVLSTGDAEFFAQVSADDPRMAALEKWVRDGGRLILTGSPNAISLFDQGGALSRLVPGEVLPPREIRIANALVQYVPKGKNLVMTGSLDAPFLRVVPVRPDRGDFGVTVDLAEGETPLVVRRVFDFGTVTWFGGDLGAAPLARWSGRTGVWMNLFGFDTERQTAARVDSALVQRGYSDLSGQMRSALDHFEGVRPFPFSLILFLIALYIAAIGPVDWFLVHRVFHRPNLTWITLPLWILLFAGVAIWFGGAFSSATPEFNRIDLIDIDGQSGAMRGATWAGLYAPTDERLNVGLTLPIPPTSPMEEAPANIPTNSTRVEVLGLAGSGIGGMNRSVVGLGGEPPYAQVESSHANVGLADYPIPVRSSRSLFGYWSATRGPLNAGSLNTSDGKVFGTVTNPFERTIEDAVLYFGREAIPLGTLLGGETVTLDRRTRRLDSARALAGAGLADDSILSRTMTQGSITRYDTSSTDPLYILRTMMFYDLAGGRSAVGLAAGGAHRLDATELLRCGRSVFTGTLQPEAGHDESLGGATWDIRPTSRSPADPSSSTDAMSGDRAPRFCTIRIILPVER